MNDVGISSDIPAGHSDLARYHSVWALEVGYKVVVGSSFLCLTYMYDIVLNIAS